MSAEAEDFVRRLGRWAHFAAEMQEAVRENGGNGCSAWRNAQAVIECYDDDDEFLTFTSEQQQQILADLNGWLEAGRVAEASGDKNWCQAN
jgi:hypothetical protein